MRVAVAVAVAALAVAACSGGDDGAAPSTTAVPTTASTAPATTTTTAPPVPTVPAADAATLAAQLTEAERAVRAAATPPAALAAWGRFQQAAYRSIAVRPELRGPVLAAAGEDVRAAVEANSEAGLELRALTSPRPSLPAWRIVPPPPMEELLAHYKAAEREIGVGWTYLAAIHFVETKLGRIRGTSTAGAQGPMQFLPSTWRQYGAGGNIEDTRDAVFAAARLLKNNGAPDRMDNALFNYNRSRRYVTGVQRYAGLMQADEAAFRGYYHWQVFYRMVDGDRVLPEGYPEVPAAPVPG